MYSKKLHVVLLVAALLALALGGCARKRIYSTPPAHTPAQRPAEEAAPPVVAEPVESTPATQEEAEIYVVEAPDTGAEPLPVLDEGSLNGNAASQEPVTEISVQDSTLEPTQEQTAKDVEPSMEEETPQVMTSQEPEPAADPVAMAEPAPEEPVAAVQEIPDAPEDEVVPVEPPMNGERPLAAAATQTPVVPGYYIQVGSFGRVSNANRALKSLFDMGYPDSRLVYSTTYDLLRVHAGAFPDLESAKRELPHIRETYPTAYLLHHKQ